jgi:hypothetical protein
MDNRVLRALKSGTKSLCYDNSSLRELSAAIGRCGFLQSLSAKNNHLETLPQEIALLSEVGGGRERERDHENLQYSTCVGMYFELHLFSPPTCS